MFLKSISLLNFKNYAEVSVQLIDGINIFTGNNGSGKTNILDAVHYLSMCKSYFTPNDIQNIKHDETFAVINGEFILNDSVDQIFCSIRKEQKKVFKLNSEEYSKLSEHIGSFPVVMIAPQDHELITEGSDERRKFIDSIISQVDHIYLDDLIKYNKFISQRNALLKQSSRTGNGDYSLFEYYDLQIATLGSSIYEKRKQFFLTFEKLFQQSFNYITSNTENVSISYVSQLNENSLADLLKANFNRDLILEYTSAGIHKDDIEFKINDFTVKRYGSQGQQKTYTTALKLAQFEFISITKKMKPIVLLDDIYDKLDDLRVSKLMQMVNEHKFGQVLITDTNETRIKKIFDELKVSVNCFKVQNGTITNMQTG
ncbi:MAG: DNA replication/repair protein RecF [Bacteroidia bacterium]